MTIYKCNKCGFMDIMLGMQSHLVRHPECQDGNFNTYDEHGKIILGSLTKYSKVITQAEYDKELKRISEEGIKAKLKLKEELNNTMVDDTVTLKDGKKYTKNTQFQVDDNVNINTTTNTNKGETQ